MSKHYNEVCFAAHLTNCQIRMFLTLAVETKEQYSYQKIFYSSLFMYAKSEGLGFDSSR